MLEFDQNLIKKLFHLGERTPADLENPVPALTSASQLSDSAIIQAFEDLVKKIIQTDDQETALLGRRVLQDMLLPQYPQLKTEAPDAYARYQKLIALLKFMNLAVPGLAEIRELIENHLLDALRAGIFVQKKFDEVLDIYDDILLGGTIAERLGKAMMASQSRIGQKPLLIGIEQKSAPPSVANWIIDYRSVIAADRGGTFERLTYMNQSQNVKQLSREDHWLLTAVLKLYDWLRFGGTVEEAGEEKEKSLPEVGLETLPAPKPVSPPGPKVTPLAHGVGLESFKQKMEDSKPPAPVLSPEEIRREVGTEELPAASVARASNPSARPNASVSPLNLRGDKTALLLKSLNDIKVVDDLKRVEVVHLRQSQLAEQIGTLKSRILFLASVNHLLPYYVMNAFAQSPLFKAYLEMGKAKMADSQAGGGLTQEEFEAVADLRKEVERL